MPGARGTLAFHCGLGEVAKRLHALCALLPASAASALTQLAPLGRFMCSCLTVFTSYLWGVAAFGEAGSSTGLSLLGLSLIALGLGGLGAAVQAPPAQLQRVPSAESTNFFGQELSAGDEGGSMGLDTICEGEWEPDAQPAGALGSRKAGGGAEVNGGSLPDLQVWGVGLAGCGRSSPWLASCSAHAAGQWREVLIRATPRWALNSHCLRLLYARSAGAH